MEKSEQEDKNVENLSSMDLESIPESLRSADHCRDLIELYLDYNELSAIPDGVFRNMKTLKVFSAVGNCFEELNSEVGEMTALQHLFLQENQLICLPDSIGCLKNLLLLNVVGNLLKELPSTIGQMASLERLIMDENEVQYLPESFAQLSHLQCFEISENKLKALPTNFGGLKQLSVFNVSQNPIKDYLPESFSQLENLTHVDLSHNKLVELPATLKSASKLNKFYCETNCLYSLPDWVNHMHAIEEFSLRGNKIHHHPFTEEFGMNNQRLRLLDIAGNFMTALPESLGILKCLEKIDIGSVIDELERKAFQNGNLISHLPLSVSHLVMLREAHLEENQIVELPEDFGCLVSLEFLDLGQNFLKRLPDSFCSLRSLKVCQLSKNMLTHLPENIGNLQSIEDFRLDSNLLESLPPSFASLTTLHSLDLFQNHLKEFPTCLSSLRNLKRLDVDLNEFVMNWGEVPLIHTQTSYAPRDPALANNWRGRPRADKLDITITELEVDDSLQVETEEEPDDSTRYSSKVLCEAARRNLSLWKSHTTSDTERELFHHDFTYVTSDQIVNPAEDFSVDDDWDGSSAEAKNNAQDEENLCFLEVKTGDLSPVNPTELDGCFPGGEDWEEEMKKCPNPAGTRTIYGILLEHVFIPAKSHVKKFQRPSSFISSIASGQFDDAD